MPTTDTALSPARVRQRPRSRRRAALAAALLALASISGPLASEARAAGGERVWELVTAPDPNGTMVSSTLAVAPTGDRVAYATRGPTPGAEAGSSATPNVATRGPSGWTSIPMALPFWSLGGSTSRPNPVAADEDMSNWIWASAVPLLADAPPEPNMGVYRSAIGGPPTLLADAGPWSFGVTSFELSGASADAQTVVLETVSVLLPADVRTSGRQVYEITPDGLRLAGVDSAGAPLSSCGAIVGTDEFQPNPVSRDGRRVFISSPDATGCGSRKVYLREADEEGTKTTTEISASQCTRVDCDVPVTVRFAAATPSGSVAYMTAIHQMTNDDVDDDRDLYRYDVASGSLTRLSVGPPGVVAVVQLAPVHASEDGSRVYFTATGQLVPGEGGAGTKIYLADDEGVRYVATLASGESWNAGLTSSQDNVQVTPDGRQLLFTSTGKLTPDDTDTTRDVYLYDADDETLTRVSGEPGLGNGSFAAEIAQSGFISSPVVAGYPRRSLSDDGRHVFFWTDEAILPEDANQKLDVYEWHDGDLGLITSGASTAGSLAYRQASADGSSVFFTTDESLVAADDDQGDPDLYVARAGGGFPDPPAQQPPPACAGASCGLAPVERVRRPVPASVGFVARRIAPRRFGALPISTRARRRMAASGRLVLTVATPGPGRVTASARARVAGRMRTVASGRARAERAGKVRLRLALSPQARRRLSGGRALRLRIVLRRFDPDRSSVVRLTLEPPR
jgi:hypothetical protein